MRTVVFVALAGAVVLACGLGSEEPESSNASSKAGPLQEPCMSAPADAQASAEASSQDRVTICHIPPGNPANAHSITVGSAAVPAHLAHGDTEGACGGGDGGGGGGGEDGGTRCIMPFTSCPGGGCCAGLTCAQPSGEACGLDGMGCICLVIVN